MTRTQTWGTPFLYGFLPTGGTNYSKAINRLLFEEITRQPT